MELYTLKWNYENDYYVDDVKSAIWTDRYSDLGDFELEVLPTPNNRKYLVPGTFLRNSFSDRLMIINTQEYSRDAEGNRLLKVTGKSFEQMLADRSIQANQAINGYAYMIYSATQAQAAYHIVRRFAITGITEWDGIPNTFFSDTAPTGIPTYGAQAIRPSDVLSTVKNLCKPEDLGFGFFWRDATTYQTKNMMFFVHKGTERPNVIFGIHMGNLAEERHLHSKENLKTMAYVYGYKTGYHLEQVMQRGSKYSSIDVGPKRKVLHVDATDVTKTMTDPPLTEAQFVDILKTRGKEALAEHIEERFIDGKIINTDDYAYNRDYILGDIVTVVNEFGESFKARITEYIWINDSEGARSYPTFRTLD